MSAFMGEGSAGAFELVEIAQGADEVDGTPEVVPVLAQFKLLTEEFDAQFASEVRKTPLFAMPCIYKNEHFTKTDSGQT